MYLQVFASQLKNKVLYILHLHVKINFTLASDPYRCLKLSVLTVKVPRRTLHPDFIKYDGDPVRTWNHSSGGP